MAEPAAAGFDVESLPVGRCAASRKQYMHVQRPGPRSHWKSSFMSVPESVRPYSLLLI